ATKSLLKSAFVALLFAIHPLHVDSAAWVSQRKDLLCTLFGFASLLAYVKYVELPNYRRYLIVVIFFILGLMSKPMIVTFPFIMLLMDYWPLQRVITAKHNENGNVKQKTNVGRNCLFLIAEKVPLITLSLLASFLVIFTENKVGALTGIKTLSILDRLANAIVSYVKYIAMMFWPANLTFFYPHPVTIPVIEVIGALILISVITVIIFLVCRRKPYFLIGWLWYLGTLLPVIGLIQVGPHALADRYTYVPLVGLFIIVVWGITDLLQHWPFKKICLATISAAVIVSLSICTWYQVGYWKNSVTLFEHALKVLPDNYIALGNMGQYYIVNGEYDKGLDYTYKAIKMRPDLGHLYSNLAVIQYAKGNYTEAANYLTIAEKKSFKNGKTRKLLGDCYWLTGKWPQAVDAYKKALEINKGDISAKYNMALALAKMERKDDAVKQLQEILQSDPRDLNARKMLINLTCSKGDLADVMENKKPAGCAGN
ncbi:MAG: tetratricopeptide repeat protein, partial [Smithella sp.]